MKLKVEGLCQGYGGTSILEDIGFEAESGELLTILGPNGCGKSTLIKTICNVLKPRAGSISVDGKDSTSMSPDDLAKIIGYVPQTITSTGYSSVYDLVLIGRRPYVQWNYSKEDLAIAADAMITMNVNKFIDKNIQELSGGQRQRAFIARALAQQPEFFIFDEPTSSFDLRNQLDTMRIMRSIVRERNACLIVALHDLNLAIRYSDKILVLKDKKVYSMGTPEEVITPKMIKDVYGVTAEVSEDAHGLYVRAYDNEDDEMADRA